VDEYIHFHIHLHGVWYKGNFTLPNPSRLTVALGSTQLVTETNIGNLPVGKERPARKADVTAICEPIVKKMWEPRRLTTLSTLWAFTACCRNSFALHPGYPD
jgi:hypothetical protein